MLNGPFTPWPCFTQEEADAVSAVLLSNKVNYWTGEEGRSFEREFARFADTEYAIAVANGTVALDLALKGLGIGEGDEVIVTPRSFVASATAVINAGARPVFADIDPDSQNISADTIAPCLTEKTRAIICVHLAGWPCDMAAIMALAKQHKLRVIEDCAQAHGAEYQGRPVGGLGDVGCWSFCQDKIISTGGEGGMVTCNDRELWSRMWSYKDHGKSWQAVYETEHPPGFRWLHESVGTNWRMTEMQAVIGRIQLARMAEWSARRGHNCQSIWACAQRHPLFRVPVLPDNIRHAGYKCYVFLRPERLTAGWNRDRLIAEISARGVPCYSGSCSEMYLEKGIQQAGCAPAKPCGVARELGETSVMFLVHPTLRDDEIQKTCQVIDEVAKLAQLE